MRILSMAVKGPLSFCACQIGPSVSYWFHWCADGRVRQAEMHPLMRAPYLWQPSTPSNPEHSQRVQPQPLESPDRRVCIIYLFV
jgi:hypothetical protein